MGPRALYESEGWTTDEGLARDLALGGTVNEIRYRRSLIWMPSSSLR